MKLDAKFIAACRKAHACGDGLAWLEAKPRTLEELYRYKSEWFFWLDNILSKPACDAYDAAEKLALIKALKKDGWR